MKIQLKVIMQNIIKNGHLILRNNVTAYDIKNNVIEADFAEYFEESKILKEKASQKLPRLKTI